MGLDFFSADSDVGFEGAGSNDLDVEASGVNGTLGTVGDGDGEGDENFSVGIGIAFSNFKGHLGPHRTVFAIEEAGVTQRAFCPPAEKDSHPESEKKNGNSISPSP